MPPIVPQQQQSSIFWQQQQKQQQQDQQFQQQLLQQRQHQQKLRIQIQQPLQVQLEQQIQQQPQQRIQQHVQQQQQRIQQPQQQVQQQQQQVQPKQQCNIKVAERVKYKFLYVSELSPTTTSEDMKQYISKKLNIPSNEVICQILISRNQNRDELEFVSFKIGLKEDVIDCSFAIDFWPHGTVVREFQERQRSWPTRRP